MKSQFVNIRKFQSCFAILDAVHEQWSKHPLVKHSRIRPNTQYIMHPFATPIKIDNKEAVTNLHGALFFLLSKQSLQLTADDLKVLQKQLQQDLQEASYGYATTKLVAVFSNSMR